MIIIGIDPGKSGAVAVWNKGVDKIIKCPSTTEKMAKTISIYQHESYNVVAYIEKVWAFPTDARSSAFKFGVNYGKWLGILATLNINTTFVTPKKWQKHFNIPKLSKDERKRHLKEIASKYTEKKVTLYNADAILIAVYGFIKEKEKTRDEEDKNKNKR